MIFIIFQNSSELFHHKVRPGKVFVAMRGAEGPSIMPPPLNHDGRDALVGGSRTVQFLPDLRLLPLRRKRGGKSLPTYVIRVRGLNSRVRGKDTATPEPAATAETARGEPGREIPVPSDLLTDEGQKEIWYRWPEGVRGLRKPPNGAL